MNSQTEELRARFKKMGYSNRKISVCHEYHGYSSSIEVTIKDLSISLSEIKKVASEFKEISYDERSGEILEGGNTYVFVKYDYDILHEGIEQHLEEAKKLLEEIKNYKPNCDSKILVETEEVEAHLYKGDERDTFSAVIRFRNKDRSLNLTPSICIFYRTDLAEFLAINQ